MLCPLRVALRSAWICEDAAHGQLVCSVLHRDTLRVEVQLGLATSTEQPLSSTSTGLVGRELNLRHDFPVVPAQFADSNDEYCNEREMFWKFAIARIVRNGVRIHAGKSGERTNAQSNFPELSKEIRVKHSVAQHIY